MSSVLHPTIATAELQIGMFVHLDLGWMSHPFALSSFRIADANQIATIRSLGLARVRWSPEQSDDNKPDLAAATAASPTPTVAANDDVAPRTVTLPALKAARSALARQRAATARVERQYAEAARDWRATAELVRGHPEVAGQRFSALSRALVDKMLGARELSIRAVAQQSADSASHALNVGVISLLMGRQCGLGDTELHDLGVGALSHDIGKLELPLGLHKPDDSFSGAEVTRYRDHVAQGVTLGKQMGLSPGALLVIAQHHEHCDGSGFPQGVDVNRISVAARVTALVNCYDNLCHPAQAARALTPHEALSLLFAQGQKRFDPAILNTFVRMMGVYPPGSVVQLTDDRWAIVESVNAARPLKPKVTVHTPGVPADEAPMLDLALDASLGIRRSVPATQLPRDVQSQLLARVRSAWYFEVDDEPNGDPPSAPAPLQH